MVSELSSVANEFLRAEIDEFVERPDERERLIALFGQASSDMQEISAAIVKGEHHRVDELTTAALADGRDGARGDGRRADRGHGAGRHQVQGELPSSSPKSSPARAP